MNSYIGLETQAISWLYIFQLKKDVVYGVTGTNMQNICKLTFLFFNEKLIVLNIYTTAQHETKILFKWVFPIYFGTPLSTIFTMSSELPTFVMKKGSLGAW